MEKDEREVIVQVESLYKQYGSLSAVDGISFNIYRSEVLGFLGPNGAGKSTTIDLITTLQRPSSGNIYYPGLGNTNQMRLIRQHIGIVPQELAIYGNLSVRDNLIYIGEMYGLHGKRLHQRIEQLLKEFGLLDKAGERARTLSGGLKRRLNFALADIHSPELIFLDEPTVGLDPNARQLVWQIVQDFRQAGKTVLLTTHYMEEAEVLCDRIILIDRGKIIAQGTPGELKSALGDELVLTYHVSGLVPGQIIAALSQVPGVRQVSGEGNTLRLVVRRDQAEAVKGWLAGERLAVNGLVTEDISLEDVFVYFTGRHLQEADSAGRDQA
ncbi:MAG TPA: ABC transporter ATP-binding protein [Anaerolineales bacterium]|nr:ABC transporter ATP-binding protein [Anaerolineales bacterium]